MAENKQINFNGKIVQIYLANFYDAYSGGISLQDAEIRELNGRLFVCGVVVENVYDWASGQRAGIALDQIALFVEFDTTQEYRHTLPSPSKLTAVKDFFKFLFSRT